MLYHLHLAIKCLLLNVRNFFPYQPDHYPWLNFNEALEELSYNGAAHAHDKGCQCLAQKGGSNTISCHMITSLFLKLIFMLEQYNHYLGPILCITCQHWRRYQDLRSLKTTNHKARANVSLCHLESILLRLHQHVREETRKQKSYKGERGSSCQIPMSIEGTRQASTHRKENQTVEKFPTLTRFLYFGKITPSW